MPDFALPQWFDRFEDVHALNMALGLVRQRLVEIRANPKENWPGEAEFGLQVWHKVEASLLSLLEGVVR